MKKLFVILPLVVLLFSQSVQAEELKIVIEKTSNAYVRVNFSPCVDAKGVFTDIEKQLITNGFSKSCLDYSKKIEGTTYKVSFDVFSYEKYNRVKFYIESHDSCGNYINPDSVKWDTDLKKFLINVIKVAIDLHSHTCVG